jgi:AmmeMemoRadiSam system protein B
MMRSAAGTFVTWLAIPPGLKAAVIPNLHPFSSIYSDRQVFLEAIERERVQWPRKIPVTGISVPHHLLAVDLIARGFWTTQGNEIERVIIFSPAHFDRVGGRLAATRRAFETVFGTVSNDVVGSSALLDNSSLFKDSDLFDGEHGIQALLPFVKWFHPEAKVVPIAISPGSSRTEWDEAVCAIKQLVNPRTLLVQSTDFSHYLRPELAMQRDQETLNVIAAEDREALTQLVHPDHLDSKACQYIQMALQAELKSRPIVVASRNSAEYVSDATRTTSYIVQIYTTDIESGFPSLYDDQKVFYFAGDAFLGRWMTQYLMNATALEQVILRIRTVTGGAPMIINLEGVLLDEPPDGLPVTTHAMHAPLAIPILKALNVQAASLANNHSFDLGDVGVNESERILASSGIAPLVHGQCSDLGLFRVLPLNFVGGSLRRGYPLIREDQVEDALCCAEGKPPLFAFVHWGREYTTAARALEYEVSASLYNCGVSAIVGAHSHQAAEKIDARSGGEYQLCYSLGNFIFDQYSSRSSSALLELRIFDQKTFATRLIPLPNMFELAQNYVRTTGAG